MDRRITLCTHIPQRLYEAPSKQLCPHPVHQRPCRQRVILGNQPLRKSQTVVCCTFRKRVQCLRHFGLNYITRRLTGTTSKSRGGPFHIFRVLDHDRNASRVVIRQLQYTFLHILRTWSCHVRKWLTKCHPFHHTHRFILS